MERRIIVVLHNVRSIHNVGSIFRTADAAGAEKIYLCGITPAPVDRLGRYRAQFMKTSLGAERAVPWESVRQTGRLLTKLKREKYVVLAVEQYKDAIPYHRLARIPRFKRSQAVKVAVVLGGEVKGLPRTILAKADLTVEIPMHGAKESLNVSVAAGVVLYRLRYL